MDAADHIVRDPAALAALYGAANENSLRKERPAIIPAYRALIEAAPFAVLATAGPGGLDASPRGDPAGLLHVEDERTVLLPDRRGNNRIDSLLNVLADPRVALLLMVPGANETLRINGRAAISIDPALCARFAIDDKPARSVLVIAVESVYFQCARALMRSRLWQPETWPDRATLPGPGAMLQAAIESRGDGSSFDGATYDREQPARAACTLY